MGSDQPGLEAGAVVYTDREGIQKPDHRRPLVLGAVGIGVVFAVVFLDPTALSKTLQIGLLAELPHAGIVVVLLLTGMIAGVVPVNTERGAELLSGLLSAV